MKHMQQELHNTFKDTSQLQQFIRQQAQDITVLQNALMEERSKAKTALSMCNTAHCNHVRSLVARIESTVAPVSRLAASLQRASPHTHPKPDEPRADARLKSVLESREWTMENWDAVEDAAICWLDGLQATVSACADNLDSSTLSSRMLQAQTDRLLERLRLAEAYAAAARDGEAAATARESRAQEEAAAASATVRVLRADIDAATRNRADAEAAAWQVDGRVRAAEVRAAAAVAAQIEAEARAAEMQADLARLQAVCDEAVQPVSLLPAAPAEPTVDIAGDVVTVEVLAEVADKQASVSQEGSAQAEPILLDAQDLVLTSGVEEVDCPAGGSQPGHNNESSVDVVATALEPSASESGQVTCETIGGDNGGISIGGGTALDQAASSDQGLAECQNCQSSPAGSLLQLDDVATEIQDSRAGGGLGCAQAKSMSMAAVVMARESLGIALDAAQGAWMQATAAADSPVDGVDQQPGQQQAQPDGVPESSSGACNSVMDAFVMLRAADDELGKSIEQLCALQQARQSSDGQTGKGDCVDCHTVLQQLQADRGEALQRLHTTEVELAAAQQRVGDLQECRAAAEVETEKRLQALQAAVAAAREECCSLRAAAAVAETSLQCTRVAASAMGEQLEAAQKTAESAAENAQTMQHGAAQLQEEIAQLTEAARQAGLREAAAVQKAGAAEERCAEAEALCSKSQAQVEVYVGRCGELQKTCLLAELRADDAEAALRQVEAVHLDALHAQQAAADRIAELQTGSLRAAVAASRRASKAAAVIADAEQQLTARNTVSGGGGVAVDQGGSGPGAAGIATSQQPWLPALQEQMRGLRAAVDEWLQRLDVVEAGSESASLRGPPVVANSGAAVSGSHAACTCPVASLEVAQVDSGEEQAGRSQSTLDALLSSANELSMLETTLQQPDTAGSVQVLLGSLCDHSFCCTGVDQ